MVAIGYESVVTVAVECAKHRMKEDESYVLLHLLLMACRYLGWPLRGLCPLIKSIESRAGLLAASRRAEYGRVRCWTLGLRALCAETEPLELRDSELRGTGSRRQTA